jgi:hypothetical protein
MKIILTGEFRRKLIGKSYGFIAEGFKDERQVNLYIKEFLLSLD